MKLGYLQKKIIEIGKEKGFITSDDLKLYYQPQFIQREMNKLVIQGFFEEPEDCVTYIKWRFKNGNV